MTETIRTNLLAIANSYSEVFFCEGGASER